MLEPAMFSYAIKRVLRGWKLYTALFLGVMLAATFFGGVNIGADTVAFQAVELQLKRVLVDASIQIYQVGRAVDPQLLAAVSSVQGVKRIETISRLSGEWALEGGGGKNFPSFLVGLSNDSIVYQGMRLINGSSTLGVNETYIVVGTEMPANIKLGDKILYNVTRYTYPGTIYNDSISPSPTLPTLKSAYPLNLTVAGFVSLTPEASSVARNQYVLYPDSTVIIARPPDGGWGYGGLLLASREGTFDKLFESYIVQPENFPFVTSDILIFLDRETLVNPWDMGASAQRTQRVVDRINNKVTPFGVYVQDNLSPQLQSFQFQTLMIRFVSIVSSLPVFFIAWYMGTTVSDVSFNLRRREIGLLLTKGFSRRQLLTTFLSEALFVGLVGGGAGLALAYLLNPFFITTFVSEFTGAPAVSPDAMILVIAFSLIIALFSTFGPARRASDLGAVDALREYRYVEGAKPYRRLGPWLAFLLGAYKLGVLLLGINVPLLASGTSPANIFVFLLVLTGVFIDSILIFIGPVLFLWGFTKLFIRGSFSFQRLISRLAKPMGELRILATRSIQRNPARVASIAFLLSLIMGYSFIAIGTLSTEEDFALRQIQSDVGADVNVQLLDATNATGIEKAIEALPEVERATVEFTLWVEVVSRGTRLKAIDPSEWPSIAFYEEGWFIGDPQKAFQAMAGKNESIVLETGVARYLGLDVGENVTLTFRGATGDVETRGFKIVGLTGREPQDPATYYGGIFWSYIPKAAYLNLTEELGLGFSEARILVKLKPGAEGEAIADKIGGIDSDIGRVVSVAERLRERRSNIFVNGPLNILGLGVAFAIVAASGGTALVTLVSLKERGREVSLTAVRGFSRGQLMKVMLLENLAVVTFAILLGAVVGLIEVRGNVEFFNAVSTFSIISRRVYFPPEALVTLVLAMLSILASSAIPILVMTRRYATKLERIVR